MRTVNVHLQSIKATRAGAHRLPSLPGSRPPRGPSLRPAWLGAEDEPFIDAVARAHAGEGSCCRVWCLSASRVVSAERAREMHSWTYIQGAADDEENWARGLCAAQWWLWHAEIMSLAAHSHEAAEEKLQRLQAKATSELSDEHGAGVASGSCALPTRVWQTELFVGGESSAQPPAVWRTVDAVLSVGEAAPALEKVEPHHSQACAITAGDQIEGTYSRLPRCVHLPIYVGKRAQPSKDHWQRVVLPSALAFVHSHLASGHRVLVHCDHGDDRAPAVVAAALVALFDERFVSLLPRFELRRHGKERIRAALGMLQAAHVATRVPRFMMKELNNFFMGHRMYTDSQPGPSSLHSSSYENTAPQSQEQGGVAASVAICSNATHQSEQGASVARTPSSGRSDLLVDSSEPQGEIANANFARKLQSQQWLYALLVTRGFEDIAATSLLASAHAASPAVCGLSPRAPRLPTTADLVPPSTATPAPSVAAPRAMELAVPPPVAVARGFELGAAGGLAPLLVTAAQPLQDALLSHHVISAALALVMHEDVEALDSDDASTALAAVAVAFGKKRSEWANALRVWHWHTKLSTCDPGSSSLADGSFSRITFRVATLRGGKQSLSSRQLDACIGGSIFDWQRSWAVALDAPSLIVLCIVAQQRMTIGIVLPPFLARPSSVLPEEPRAWLLHGAERAHMRPSRAACLVRMLCPCDGDVLLDPCGGLGVIAIEAASLAALLAISMDTDATANAAAAANAVAARSQLRGCVHVVNANALTRSIRASSVDACIADLPFGFRHARLDVGALFRALARVVRAGGRVLLIGGAGPGGTAAACLKAAPRSPPGAWNCKEQRHCASGGIACVALLFVRVGISDSGNLLEH